MRAVELTGTMADSRVEVREVDAPQDEAERIVVDVASAGITRMEPRWATSWRYADGTPRRPPVKLGLEFAGRVRSLGLGVRGFAPGQDVLGMIEPSRGGALAEAVSAPAHQVCGMPPGLSYEDASVLPLAGLTAWQGIVRHGELAPGQRVLIQGGAGGVGAFATQIARWIGAHVTVTAAARDLRLCRELGADEVIDFERERFEDRGARYDLVFDQIGGEVQDRSWGVLKRGGRLITIAGEQDDAPDQMRARALGVTAKFFVVESDLGELRRLVDLVIAGSVRSVIGERFDLSSVPEAFGDRCGHFPGKAVLIRPEASFAAAK